MKENDFAILREQLQKVYIDLYRLQREDTEKYANEIANLKEIATAIKQKMALYKVELASERIAKKGR